MVCEYNAKSMSQQILLRGPVGTGKTNLAFDTARNSSDRTIVLDAAATMSMDFDTWQDIPRRSMPSMVVFADVTPERESALGRDLEILQPTDLPITVYLTDGVFDWTFEAEEAYGSDRIVDMQMPSEKERRRVREVICRASEVGWECVGGIERKVHGSG